MRVYVLLEKIFNDDSENEMDTQVNGVFEDIEMARAKMSEKITDNIEKYDFVEDTEYATGKNNRIIFYDHQENWQNYIEYQIVKREVK